MHIDNEIANALFTVRAALSHSATVRVSRFQEVIQNVRGCSGQDAEGWVITFGDICDQPGAIWKWDCAHSDSLAACTTEALAKIAAQGDERKRARAALLAQADALGLTVTEKGAA